MFNPNVNVEKIKALILIFNKVTIFFSQIYFFDINYVTSFCNIVSIFHFSVENKENKFLIMDPSQTINLIALSLIVVIHAGVLALRLGISLARS